MDRDCLLNLFTNFYSSDEIVAAKNALFEAAKKACTDTAFHGIMPDVILCSLDVIFDSIAFRQCSGTLLDPFQWGYITQVSEDQVCALCGGALLLNYICSMDL